MKKMILVLLMIFALSGIAFPCDVPAVDTSTSTATATATGNGGAGGAGGVGGTVVIGNTGTNFYGSQPVLSPSASATGGTANATIEKGAIQNNNSNLNVNTNVFDQTNTFKPTNNNTNLNINDPTFNNKPTFNNSNKQSQGQIQGQSQNNKQIIAPVQEVNTPQSLLPVPSQTVPGLFFGSGHMKDITNSMPNFAIFGIARYNGEAILDVLNVNANVKFKNYFKAVIDDAKGIAGTKGFKSSDIKIIVICAEAQKSWTTGGTLGGGGSV